MKFTRKLENSPCIVEKSLHPIKIHPIYPQIRSIVKKFAPPHKNSLHIHRSSLHHRLKVPYAAVSYSAIHANLVLRTNFRCIFDYIFFFIDVFRCPVGEENSDKRSEEHTSELQSRFDLVCRLL